MAKYRNKNQLIRDAKLSKLAQNLKDWTDNVPDLDYDGRTVMLRTEWYDLNRSHLSTMFLEWYDANRGNQFIARHSESSKGKYELEGVENWLFVENSFLTTCDSCGKMINMNEYYCKHCGHDYTKGEE